MQDPDIQLFLKCRYMVQALNFTGMEVDEALRVFQTHFILPVSSMVIVLVFTVELTQD